MPDPDAYSDDGDEFDEVDSASRRSNSPTKMTARQRSKGNKDAQDHLLALPNGESDTSKAPAISSSYRWTR
jgi:Ino eighty subunit 2